MKSDKNNSPLLNIRSDASDPRAQILSNLAHTPFKIGEYEFYSVESALQGIKFSDPKKQAKVFAMNGKDALRSGREITFSIEDNKKFYVYWQGEKIEYNSDKHRLLIATFIHEKVRQNPEVQEALLATEGSFIFHDVGIENPHTSLPEKFYIEVLLAERKLLKKLKSLH